MTNDESPDANSPFVTRHSLFVIQFLPDFALWPGLGLGVDDVQFDDGAKVHVEVPKSDSNIGMKDKTRSAAVQDNFIRASVPVPAGAKTVRVIATTPGVVIDRVGITKGN